MKHLHRAKKYTAWGKPDCLYIKCKCGYEMGIGTWHFDLPNDWDPIHWRLYGHQKAIACEKRWAKHVKKMHRIWNKHRAEDWKIL